MRRSACGAASSDLTMPDGCGKMDGEWGDAGMWTKYSPVSAEQSLPVASRQSKRSGCGHPGPGHGAMARPQNVSFVICCENRYSASNRHYRSALQLLCRASLCATQNEHRRGHWLNNRAEKSHQPTRTGAKNAPIQVDPSGATIPIYPRCCRLSFPTTASSAHGRSLPEHTVPTLSRVGHGSQGDRFCYLYLMNVSLLPICLFSTLFGLPLTCQYPREHQCPVV